MSYSYDNLYDASQYGDHELLKKIIDSGLNIDNADDMGRTALIFAASELQFNCVKLLIDSGCNVNKMTILGETALQACLHNCYKDASLEIVEILINSGTNLDNLDKICNSALTHGFINDKIRKLLLDGGANPNLKTQMKNPGYDKIPKKSKLDQEFEAEIDAEF